ncbi:1303_t:CDS:2 [Paraglomus occultum]|uniref:1303_t:CDS:1 n=1 Tax=Paraglomus occultum TaxID=144539 RepID=A0A9N8VYW3_9GLOM|nr:1303_t:CDS:2 [Paraglomus occultum]
MFTPPSPLQLSHAFTTPPLQCQSPHTPPTISPSLQPIYTTTTPTTPPPLPISMSGDTLTPTSENLFDNERSSYFSDDSTDEEESDDEESREKVTWYKSEFDLLIHEFDTFVQTARPPLAPFSHFRPPSNLLHRVAKKVIRKYPDWRHSTTDTMRGLRDYLRSLSWRREEDEWENV